MGTLDEVQREPLIHSDLKDYSINNNKKYFTSAIRDSVASITSTGLLAKNQSKIVASMGSSQTRNFMNKGSAEIFGQRMCNSMLSHRNFKQSHTTTINTGSDGRNDSIGRDRDGRMRASMLTPR